MPNTNLPCRGYMALGVIEYNGHIFAITYAQKMFEYSNQ
jgi:hypothetical protein